jgi:hypothetical protein
MNDLSIPPGTDRAEAGSASAPRARRGLFLKWLRKTHGWLGLWGAVLGLLFGVTGILQSHRSVLKIPSSPPRAETMQLTVPPALRNNAHALGTWLQAELQLAKPAERIAREPGGPVAWGDRTVIQPEHWTVMFRSPSDTVSADYWQGSDALTVKRRSAGIVATMENFHRANGVGVGWVLLADSFAGSMIILSITGVLIWTELNKRKTLGVAIFIAAMIALIAVTLETI